MRCALILLLLASSSLARAATFDPVGRLSLDGPGLGFEEGADDLPGTTYIQREIPVVVGDATGAPYDRAIEGERALRLAPFGPSSLFVGLPPSTAERRIDVRIWMRSEGARARASLIWWSGDAESAVAAADPGRLQVAGALIFTPTDRRTSDGWREWSSGPVDQSLAGVLRPYLVVEMDLGAAESPDAGVWIDAIEVLDVGAPVADGSMCSAQPSSCAPGGACRLGRCVDARVVDGPGFATAAHRRQYVERRRFEYATFLGHRSARQRSAATDAAFEALATSDAVGFWRSMGRIIDRTEDGHARRPTVSGASAVSPGFCLLEGEADLLVGAPRRPLVSRAVTGHPAGDLVRPGDVLVRVDDVDVDDWIEDLDGAFQFSGDPEVRRFAEVLQIASFAALAGSKLTFARCDLPCVAPIEFDVDFAELTAPVWAGQPLAWRGDRVPCDARFARIDAPNVGATDHVAFEVVDGTTVLQFNGTVGDAFGDYASWKTSIANALFAGPERVVLDQRRGDGGSFQGLYYLTSFFFAPGTEPIDVVTPWLFDREPDPTLLGALASCARDGGGLGCGGAGWVTRAQLAPEAPAAGVLRESKTAILVGLDVSGNDWLTDHLRRRRDDPDLTRVFGPVPTYGAFGQVTVLPLHDVGYAGPRVQWTGGFVVRSPADALIDPLDGRGVRPDVVVYQTQSDALAGVDTQKKEALQWLESED